ncbi:MAG TPA: aldose epimerase family protein [Puia sp.]|nr:aldose epimerase family protein [Puia sp.]
MLTGSKTSLSCVVEACGSHADKEVYLVTLSNGEITVGITNIGCSIMSIHAPDRNGAQKNIVAGFTDPLEYTRNPWYFGSVIGRYVNRIGGACFPLDGRIIRLTANEHGNQLHGGFEGFNKKVWRVRDSYQNHREAGVLFDYTSPDGEEGYPGNLDVQVRYTLNAAAQLQLTYHAVTDKSTPVNLSNHSYFNLSGFEVPHIADHMMMIRANVFAEKQHRNLPTGRLLPVRGTALDLLSPRRLGIGIDSLTVDRGFDHHFVLEGADLPGGADVPDGRHVPGGSGLMPEGGEPAVEAYDPASRRLLRVSTDRPGVQLYTANWWDGTLQGAHGTPYRRHGAFALETQAFPDSPNRPEFPGTILSPGATYETRTTFTFAIK